MGAKIYNSDLTKNIVDGAKLMTGSDVVPSELAEKVIPVLDVTPDFHRFCNLSDGSAGTTNANLTIFTAPTDRDFYMTNLQVCYMANATADNTYHIVSVVIDGIRRNLIYLIKLSLTADTQSVVLNYKIPIKLTRGSTVLMENNFTVGSVAKAGAVTGYTININ